MDRDDQEIIDTVCEVYSEQWTEYSRLLLFNILNEYYPRYKGDKEGLVATIKKKLASDYGIS